MNENVWVLDCWWKKLFYITGIINAGLTAGIIVARILFGYN